MRFAASAVAVLLVVSPSPADPGSVWEAAMADLVNVPRADRVHVRYLTDLAIPEASRGSYEKFQRWYWNAKSREAEFDLPVIVAPDLYRVDIRGIGADPEVWEKLAPAEPYFQERVQLRSGKFVRRPSRWLPSGPVQYLYDETQSRAPLVRADWFYAQTAVQDGRKAGYYEWLGVTKRADFDKLVGLSVKRARERKSEVAAIIRRSGVAQNNRQVFRFGAIDGAVWRTLDVLDDEVGRRNAVRNLDADYQHQAEEAFGPLPNGLLAMLLCDAEGNLQNTAPDKIGADTTATSNDRRIHVGLCFRCHREGLRPLDDYARKLYQAPGGFATDDYEKFKRLRQLYLGDLQRHLVKDRQAYEFALMKLTGWTTAQLADETKRWWRFAVDEEVSLEQAALELGFPPQKVQETFTRLALAPPAGLGRVDPVLAAFARDPPGKVNRQQWEEVYQTAAAAMYGGVTPE